MRKLTPTVVFEKAVARYYRDAEQRGQSPQTPIADPKSSVNLRQRVVSLQGEDGELASYAFTHTVTGKIRFRPEWPGY